jgi:hypothetical protein
MPLMWLPIKDTPEQGGLTVFIYLDQKDDCGT